MTTVANDQPVTVVVEFVLVLVDVGRDLGLDRCRELGARAENLGERILRGTWI